MFELPLTLQVTKDSVQIVVGSTCFGLSNHILKQNPTLSKIVDAAISGHLKQASDRLFELFKDNQHVK